VTEYSDRETVELAQARFGSEDESVRSAFWLKDLVFALRDLKVRRPDLRMSIEAFVAEYGLAGLYSQQIDDEEEDGEEDGEQREFDD
jgi:hypothetical protein